MSRHYVAGWGGKDESVAVSTSKELPLWPGRQTCKLKHYKWSGKWRRIELGSKHLQATVVAVGEKERSRKASWGRHCQK